MWKRADRKCVLVVAEPGGQTYLLQIVGNTSVLRSERMRSADQALLVAEIWRTEEAESIYGATPPA